MPKNAANLAAFAERKAVAAPAHIYFTLDFREVVEGDLRPGARCHLRYDPTRMPAPPDYAFGAPEEPIVAHVQFHDGGEVHDFPLHSKTGILRHLDIDITGHGSTLDASFPVPEDADKLIIWFSHQRAGREITYDSRYGANFEFRFVSSEIRLASATLTAAPSGATNLLSVHVAADLAINRVSIVYHVAERGLAGPEKREPLADKGTNEAGEQLWSAIFEVAFGRVVILDLAYEVDGHATLDDNNQHHYLIFPPQS
jgi:hypothetical protein